MASDVPVAAALVGPGRRRRCSWRAPSLGAGLAVAGAAGCVAAALLRAVDAPLPRLRHRLPRVPGVPVGQPAARVRAARRVPARATGQRPPVHLLFRRGAVQALLRVGHRQVAVAAARLARRQRDDASTTRPRRCRPGSGFTPTTCPAWWHHFESRADAGARAGASRSRSSARAAARLVAAGGLHASSRSSTPPPRTTASSATWPLALHVFLLDDRDLDRARAWAAHVYRRGAPAFRDGSRRSAPPAAAAPAAPPGCGAAATGARGHAAWRHSWAYRCSRGCRRFGPSRADRARSRCPAARASSASPPGEHLPPVRRGHPRADRAADRDPLAAGAWREPSTCATSRGIPVARPPFVAPHQPRVDFLLWFHGLAGATPPAYLQALLDRVCQRPRRRAASFRRASARAPCGRARRVLPTTVSPHPPSGARRGATGAAASQGRPAKSPATVSLLHRAERG